MEDLSKILAAAFTGWAIFESFGGSSSRPRLSSLGPLPSVPQDEEGSFELLWAEGDSVVFEGPGRTRKVPLPLSDVLPSLQGRWVKICVDLSSIRSGTGTTELWVKESQIWKREESSTWAFRAGRPVRTVVLHLRSRRQIHGVLP